MNNPISAQSRQWLLPALSGVLIGTSYIPFPPWASLFCFVPLWIFWRRQASLKTVFLGGLLTSFIFTLIGFNWVTYLLHEFARAPWPIAVLGMAAYGLVAHLFVPVAGVLWYWGQNKFRWPDRLSMGLMALITTLCEAYSLTLFDWNFGYSWYGSNIPIFHWAEIIGFSGLSAATLLANLPMYYAWVSRRRLSGKLWLAAVLGVFALLNVGGLWLKSRLPAPDASLNALLVQGNIGDATVIAAEQGEEYEEYVLRQYFELTDQGINGRPDDIDLVLWPEAAYPSILGEEVRFKKYPGLLRRYLRDRQVPLITGAFGVNTPSWMITNSLFVLDRNGEIVPPRYDKTILLAFGEYIPGEQIFPWIRELLPPTGGLARGNGPTDLLRLGDFKIGPQVCYESLFPWFSKGLADMGAQFIVNVTNDSWYGAWQEPYQHMYMTLARGVEFRRPVLRVTNTGISTVGLASGEILQRSPIQEAWAGVYSVPYLKVPPATFYQRWFWLVPGLLWGALAVLLGMGIIHPRRMADG